MQESREIGSRTILSSTSIAYTVGIAVDPPGLVPTGGSTGNFVYQPALLHASAGDTVTWNCNNPFSLSFKGSSPIGQLEVVGSSAGLAIRRDFSRSYPCRAASITPSRCGTAVGSLWTPTARTFQ